MTSRPPWRVFAPPTLRTLPVLRVCGVHDLFVHNISSSTISPFCNCALTNITSHAITVQIGQICAHFQKRMGHTSAWNKEVYPTDSGTLLSPPHRGQSCSSLVRWLQRAPLIGCPPRHWASVVHGGLRVSVRCQWTDWIHAAECLLCVGLAE